MIACNTASAVALDVLAAELPIPVIGVVGPGATAAVEAANALRARGVEPVRIGVLGTLSTVESGAYPRAVALRSQGFEVRARPAPLLVPLVEEGWLDGQVPRLAVERYLAPLLDDQVRVVVLGCTHYPLLKPVIEELVHERLGKEAVVVDSAKATALSVAQALEARGHLTEQTHATLNLLVTDLPNSFSASASRFLGDNAPLAELVDIVPC